MLLRPIGTPIPLGPAGLAIASLVQSGLSLGWVSSSETAQVGLILIVVPMVLQLLASIFAYLARDGATGTAFGVLATSWAAQGLMHLVLGSHTSGSLGLMMLTAAAMLTLTAVAGYGVLALELEGQAGQPILPTLRPGLGEAAVSAGPAAQVENVEHEPGVRLTT